jgi:hypothetical protein
MPGQTWTNMANKNNGVVVDQNDWNAIVGNFQHQGGALGYIGCRVFHNSNQSKANATVSGVFFNSERWDTDPNGLIHDTSTNNDRLTCRTAGLYLVGCNILWAANATGDRRVWITVNATSTWAWSQIMAVTNGANTAQNLSTVVPLTVGEFVTVQCLQSSGGALDIGGSANAYECEFWMTKV